MFDYRYIHAAFRSDSGLSAGFLYLSQQIEDKREEHEIICCHILDNPVRWALLR